MMWLVNDLYNNTIMLDTNHNSERSSPRAQANAQHQRPLFGPSFEGEARGDREPAAPMRAVEEVEFRPADGPGQDSAGALDCGHILGGLPEDQVHWSGQ